MNWIQEAIKPLCDQLKEKGWEKLADMYSQCFASTWDTTLQRADETVFLITGDIPAMWLRDSSAQVYHYLPFANQYPEVKEAVLGLLARQYQCIIMDPYANAFNKEPINKHCMDDDTSWSAQQKPWIWEQKYEIDSLCYPIRLTHAFWKKTGSLEWAGDPFLQAARAVLQTWKIEQHHEEQSPYFFRRVDCVPTDTLSHDGKGTPVAYTGMTWSGFRPSDDACRYGYLIPSNFFAVRSLTQLTELLEACRQKMDSSDEVNADVDSMIRTALELKTQIQEGLRQYAVTPHPEFGDVYAYEVDGLGHFHWMDDANVPSLLSLPYLGCLDPEDPVYQNTRRMLLSPANPFYYEGTVARGIGSPHTPKDYIWPISLCIQGLTATDDQEIIRIVEMLENMDAGTLLMHEGVHKDDPSQYTRPWFAWANSIFSELIEKAAPILPQK